MSIVERKNDQVFACLSAPMNDIFKQFIQGKYEHKYDSYLEDAKFLDNLFYHEYIKIYHLLGRNRDSHKCHTYVIYDFKSMDTITASRLYTLIKVILRDFRNLKHDGVVCHLEDRVDNHHFGSPISVPVVNEFYDNVVLGTITVGVTYYGGIQANAYVTDRLDP